MPWISNPGSEPWFDDSVTRHGYLAQQRDQSYIGGGDGPGVFGRILTVLAVLAVFMYIGGHSSGMKEKRKCRSRREAANWTSHLTRANRDRVHLRITSTELSSNAVGSIFLYVKMTSESSADAQSMICTEGSRQQYISFSGSDTRWTQSRADSCDNKKQYRKMVSINPHKSLSQWAKFSRDARMMTGREMHLLWWQGGTNYTYAITLP
jgi:hypothetical protein